jgi:hypothetical protein
MLHGHGDIFKEAAATGGSSSWNKWQNLGVLVPKLRLGTSVSRALLANHLYFSMIVQAEPRSQAFPGRAQEREKLSNYEERASMR